MFAGSTLIHFLAESRMEGWIKLSCLYGVYEAPCKDRTWGGFFSSNSEQEGGHEYFPRCHTVPLTNLESRLHKEHDNPNQ